MIIFVLHLGLAYQCFINSGNCSSVPYEAVANMVQFGFLELIVEIGGYYFYKKKAKKDDGKDE